MARTLLLLVLSSLAAVHSYSDSEELKGEGFVGSHNRHVVCYVSSWAAYRPEKGNFSLSYLDPRLCTHFVYAFAGLNETSSEIRALDPYRDLEEDYGLGWYRQLTLFKKRYPHLKVTLAVGGWNEGSPKYSKMASDPALRAKFIASVVRLLEKHDFDGLDLDWEFPANRDGKPYDKENFVLLVQELRAAMPNKILTAALGAGRHIISSAYDIPALSKSLDLLHIMAYDYHGSWDGKTGSNAPLYTKDSNDYLSISATVKYLKQLGAPSRKIVLGIPMYGRTFLLKNAVVDNNQQVPPKGDDAQERGFQGPYTREDGFMGYNEICKDIEKSNSSWKVMWDDISKTPYAVNMDKWIGYDNERSVAEKAKFAIDENLGGVMVWSVDTDDFLGDCKEKDQVHSHYPLVTTLNVAMAQALEKQNEIPLAPTESPKPTYSVNSTATGINCAISVLTILLMVLCLSR